MSLPMRAILLALISFLFLTPAGLARTDEEAKKAELERVLRQLQATVEDRASLAQLTFPEDTSQRFLVKELRISGNSLISTAKLLEKLPVAYTIGEEIYDFRVLLDVILNPGQDREVSLTTIQGLTKYVLSVYQEKGYAGIYVYVPAEAIKGAAELVDGILPIHVLEGEVAEIAVERYDFDRQKVEKGFLKDSVLKSWSPVKVGQVIQKKKLDDFVSLLNLNPDRYISAVISRSADPDKLNLGYDIYEANPWHWYIQVDNAGTKERQWAPRVGVINTNLTGIDDRFSAMFQAPWESGLEDNYALFGSYEFPIFTPRLRLNLYSGYSEFDITPEGGPFNFLGRGSFYGGTLRYNAFQTEGWFFDVTGSLSHERSKITPALFPAATSDVKMDLWGIGVEMHRSDDMSDTSLTFNRIESISGSSKDEFMRARLFSDPDFTIYTASAAHSQYLDPNKIQRLSGSFRWITSDERLAPAKMTTFGGLYSVRGYEEDEIVADGGVLASVQYEFDLVKYDESKEIRETETEQKQAKKPWLRKLAPLVFADYGQARIKDPIIGEDKTQELYSIGVGIAIRLGDNFDGGIYYGWPFKSTAETGEGDGRLNVSLIMRW